MSDDVSPPCREAEAEQQARLVPLRPHDLSSQQQQLYDEITRGPRATGPQAFPLTDPAGRLLGPFNAMLLSPEVGGPLQRLGSAIRHRSSLTDRHREIAILIVANHWESSFEVRSHEAVALAVGVTAAELEALREVRLDAFAGADGTVARLAFTLVTAGTLNDEDYSYFVSSIGLQELFEITSLVGYYATLALQMRVFGVR